MNLILSSILLAAFAASSVQAACSTPESEGRIDIYPTAEDLPENLLRFYVYFPRSMGQQDILLHIEIRDEAGNPVDGALLSNRYDLWSPDRRRLTLLLDPGRVKTGLAAHEAMGRALQPDQRYSLSIRGTATDAEGCALGQDRVHGFRVGPADLTPPRRLRIGRSSRRAPGRPNRWSWTLVARMIIFHWPIACGCMTATVPWFRVPLSLARPKPSGALCPHSLGLRPRITSRSMGSSKTWLAIARASCSTNPLMRLRRIGPESFRFNRPR